MANNIVKYNTRVQLKYDTLTEWDKVKSTFVPLKGEVCVVNPSENLGSGSTTALFKVGDGEKTFEKLPYVSALAADVYGWAKLPLDKFDELLEKGTLTYGGTTYTCTSFATAAALEALAGDIRSINNKISNAMHFLGTTTTPLSDGATTKSLAGIDAEDIISGAVVIAPYTDKTERYEFVWTGSAWEMLGQEGSFAIKGSILDEDIAANANIDSDKIKTTLNKTNLTGDITNLNNRLT